MKLTKMEEQGLRLTMSLARANGQMTLPSLAALKNLSEALVAKVLSRLRQGGVVHAVRGRNGGYELSEPAEALSVSRVLTSLGKPLLQGCFNNVEQGKASGCPHAENCGLRPVWEYLEAQISKVLQRITIANLIQREDEVRRDMARIWEEEAILAEKLGIQTSPAPCSPLFGRATAHDG